MTAEIAVLNRVGVALAADSAVTVGPQGHKIWTSGEKLFQVSEVDPVGIMIYGNADFVGLPWETVIKAYRSNHGRDSFDTVADHVSRFLSFLSNSHRLFPIAVQDRLARRAIQQLFTRIRERIRKAIDKAAEKSGSIGVGDDALPPIVGKEVLSFLRQIRKKPPIEGLTPAIRRALRTKHTPDITQLALDVFGTLPMSISTHRALVSAGLLCITRRWPNTGTSGIVFAGFGSIEYLPSFHVLELDGMVENVPRVGARRSDVISDTNRGTVVPFAQQEMVHAFMNGIDPRLQRAMEASTRGLFHKTFSSLLSITKSAAPAVAAKFQHLENALDTLVQALHKDWDDVQEEFWAPVVLNISTLPKDELAAMAEAFVNLTKFRRRASNEKETVGGPIDVAVITKGDGFVWIKRKHYFDPELNPRIMAKYHVPRNAK